MPHEEPTAAENIERANELVNQAYELLSTAFTAPMPVGRVQWVPLSKVHANDYNPNSVAAEEMTLLHTSIAEDGYTQPVVTVYDAESDRYVIVDGFHRYTTMRRYQDIADSTQGHLPVVVIEKEIEDRIAATVRHNRARGKHSVQGMGSLVFQMLEQGEDDATICRKIGVDAEELARLKHVTGYSALYKNHEYSKAVLTESQMREKAKYKREHPDENVPRF